eukprot:CAMPEP_0198152176 /NCGR_PEP_ID=MMETSP1443-20131203/58746_1 /TAXON_ID=186043 /ORGANISM="Entomoneis sp., Strain CCMP2396" /LENGTH=180 /DNA_ID=CAMNT_0043818105 /DNA_START=232 /DNA_END=774 /DNA_ORIENTATION=-
MTAVRGFATYMLSSGGCYIELDSDEVIMNNRVEAVVANPSLEIVVVSPETGVSIKSGSSPSDPQTIILDDSAHSFPLEVQLKVLPTPPSSSPRPSGPVRYSYEFILQLDETSKAVFEHGACDGDKRVAGRSFDSRATFSINSPTEVTVVQGAWTAGHAAVKLLQGLKFVPASAAASGDEL